jgi:hypothetical protein
MIAGTGPAMCPCRGMKEAARRETQTVLPEPVENAGPDRVPDGDVRGTGKRRP